MDIRIQYKPDSTTSVVEGGAVKFEQKLWGLLNKLGRKQQDVFHMLEDYTKQLTQKNDILHERLLMAESAIATTTEKFNTMVIGYDEQKKQLDRERQLGNEKQEQIVLLQKMLSKKDRPNYEQQNGIFS